jgi:hypothetical protein
MKRLNDPTNRVIVAAGAVLAIVLLAVVLVAPRLLYPPLPASRFVGVAPDKRIELETNRLKLQNDARTTLAQILAGGILLLGAYLTWRQLQVNREGQITDRYTKAVDQLGHAELDVRLGGIYALERIARDSRADLATIGEVLSAFVRGHAPWPPRLPGQYVATAPIHEVPELQVRAPDVQACLTVLGRGGFAPSASCRDRLDLHATDLRHAELRGAHLETADLRNAHLEGAHLGGAHLELANLNHAHLDRAVLRRAHLQSANLAYARLVVARLEEARLEGANLMLADLGGAHLFRVHLEEAHLVGTNLEVASMCGAYLEGANLRAVNLYGMLADKHAVWPAGFDWRATGVIMAGEEPAASPSQQE